MGSYCKITRVSIWAHEKLLQVEIRMVAQDVKVMRTLNGTLQIG